MKRFILIQSIVLCSFINVFSQQGWYALNTGTLTNFNSVYFYNVNTGYAVGDSGRIVKTLNGGLSWNQQTLNIYYRFNSVIFTDANNGYICGDSNYTSSFILKTTNSGLSWFAVFQSTQIYLNSINFINPLLGFAGGYNGTMIKTTDGGNSWQSLNYGSLYPMLSIHFTGTETGYAVGGLFDFQGMILKTSNGGINWSTQFTTAEPIFSVNFINDNTGYAVGGDFEFGVTTFKTSNGGTVWTQTNTSVFGMLKCVQFTTPDTGYSAGFYFTDISKTIDGGNTWRHQYTSMNSIPNNLFMLNSQTGYAVGTNGLILKTTTGGYFPFDTVSSKYLPLQIGNVWVYKHWYKNFGENNWRFGGRMKYTISGDTLMPNGKWYFKNAYPGYIRIDSLSLNVYKYTSSNETKIDSLLAKLNDTVITCYRVSDTTNKNIFGQSRRNKLMETFCPITNSFLRWNLTYNIGYSTNGKFPDITDSGYSDTLLGCVINGVVYGDTAILNDTISGTVRYLDNNQPVTGGYVKALILDKNSGQVITVDSTRIQTNGAYMLPHVHQDSTYIMAYADDVDAPIFVPTYYDTTIYWRNAHVIYPTGNMTNIDIHVFRANPPSGPMHLGGGVFTNQNFIGRITQFYNLCKIRKPV